MKHAILAALASLTLLFTACAVEPQEPSTPDDEADLGDVDDASEAPSGLKEIPAELSLTTNVPAGCAAEARCSGAKTCTAWTSYSQCAASFQTCAPQCGIPGRGTGGGTCYLITHVPRNRFRYCTIRATGAACTEVDYLPNPGGCSNE